MFFGPSTNERLLLLPLGCKLGELLLDEARFGFEHFGVVSCGFDDLLTEQQLEGFAELARDATLVVDVDFLEDRLVHLASDGRPAGPAGAGPFVGKVECPIEVRLDFFEANSCGSESDVYAVQLVLDAVLFGLHEIERYRIGVVRLEQLGLFVEKALLAFGLSFVFLVGCGFLELHLIEDQVSQLVEKLRGRLHTLVVLFNEGFDSFDQYGLLRAVGGLLLSTGADEVRVDLAALASVVRYEQA